MISSKTVNFNAEIVNLVNFRSSESSDFCKKACGSTDHDWQMPSNLFNSYWLYARMLQVSITLGLG